MRQAINFPGMSQGFANASDAKPSFQASGPANGFVLTAKNRMHGGTVCRLPPIILEINVRVPPENLDSIRRGQSEVRGVSDSATTHEVAENLPIAVTHND